MTHEKLIAKLRNRATAYSPQNQQETMLEAARVIEEYDRLAGHREPPAIDADEEPLHPECGECSGPSPQDVIRSLGICTGQRGCEGCAFISHGDKCGDALMLAADKLIRAKYGEG